MTIAWTPTDDAIAQANSTRFAAAHGIGSDDELRRHAIDEPEWFWDAVVRWLPIEFAHPYQQVLDRCRGIEWPRWFLGGRLNLAWNCVGRHAQGPGAGRDAIRWDAEDGRTGSLTFAELDGDVSRLASGLASIGVGPGDRVALVLPMVPEAVVALYAVARLAAISVPIFSGFAAAPIATRLVDAGVTCVVTAHTGRRRGQPVPIKATVDAAVAAAPSVRHVVVLDDGADDADAPRTPGRDIAWRELVAGGDPTHPDAMVESEHGLMIAYTSGTTGRPKGAVHVHAGFLVKVAAEVHFQCDVHDGDALTWVSDLGWIQGPWMIVGAHALGQTVGLMDGAPDFPDAGRLWRHVEQAGLTFIGVSPSLVRGLKSAGDEPVTAADRSTLRAIGCAGEPIDPGSYRWLVDVVGDGRCPIINLSGGTEVAASFLSSDVANPIEACSLGRPALGMAMEVRDAEGRPLGPGDGVGELVCTAPWPSMTRGFWGDDQRYLEAYWSRWPGVWVHGDWASISAGGAWYLHGRSDDTMNVAGKRIAAGEYEAILLAHPAVAEACAVALPHPVKGEVAHCYVRLEPGRVGDEPLRAALVRAVDVELGKAFRPGSVHFVDLLPKTRSQKIVRRAVRALALGQDPGDVSTLEDPAALAAIRSAR